MRHLIVAELKAAPVSVAEWLSHLSPEAMAQYYFTAYDCLLSHSAMERLLSQDFGTEGAYGLDTQTVANLRTALGELYEGFTCELRRDGSKHVLTITVPGGSLTTWPPQIPQPGPVLFPTVDVLPHEVREPAT